MYASEVYYNLNITQIRQIEKIEETHLSKLFKTSRNCPISQLYLESGVNLARHEIQKRRLMYLKYLLDQDKESKIQRFLFLQLQYPTKGDWASMYRHDLNELDIQLTLSDIQKMTRNSFKQLIRNIIYQALNGKLSVPK